MKQITLSVPEEKYEFFMELLTSIDFVAVGDITVTEEQKEFVRERKRTATQETLKNWDDVRRQFKIS